MATLELWGIVQGLGWPGAEATGPHLECSMEDQALVVDGLRWIEAQSKMEQTRQAERQRREGY
jgi:hypothetical protein